MAIPESVVARLKAMPAAEAVRQGMELLLQIDAAGTLVYEAVEGDRLELGQVVGDRAEILTGRLAKEDGYGRPLAAGKSLARRSLEGQTALLVMGKAQAGEPELPAGLVEFLLEGEEEGNVGFIYVLPLVGAAGQPLGALTLIRPAGSGPLNHEQPQLVEGMRRELSRLLTR